MIASLCLVGCMLLGQAGTAAEDELQMEVRRLVRQLNATQLAERESAEETLLTLGPKVLDLLPPVSDRTPAEVKQRLGRVRQKLQRETAESAARASLVSLGGDPQPLSKILASLEEQSGNKIVDFREQFGQPAPDPELRVSCDKEPFWEALDRVLDQAKLTVYPYGEETAINLVARGEDTLTRGGGAHYGGPFRFEPLRIVARREFREPDGQSLQLTLFVEWEPRLKPISLKQKMADVKAIDENGDALAVDDPEAELEVPSVGATSVELILPLKLPPRDVKQIASLKGKLAAMVPGKIETFTFSDLTTAKNVEQRIAGVIVTLEQARKNGAVWEVRVRVRFDEAGEALQSHRGWIFNNEAYLQGADGKPIPYDSLETTLQTPNEVGVAYLFVLEEPPEKHQFVYKTPGVIVATEFDYEIRDLKLP
ncbi:MAG: hypothetical protein JXB62_09305 [Pirellulales bacterium]|nr:hypothetical protein [Pirellulales bacterium]